MPEGVEPGPDTAIFSHELMAGSRNFRISTISREDLMALTEEAARVSGIPYVTDAYREEAEKILAEELSGPVHEIWTFDSGHPAASTSA